ncbi:hypothetical protein [Pseudodesulfovibrio indicus]|uniref:hypothetical protein n=1 Tax=Pseudodesulfovibrio indicus TaxID=1716143 RepID=UPI0010635946|nr:hypothetical protein [Pseudodesulfovibrio indicus]
MKPHMMSLHVEIDGLYGPTRTGEETELAEQLRRAVSCLGIDRAKVQLTFSTTAFAPSLGDMLEKVLADRERDSECSDCYMQCPEYKGSF